jgi:Tfp pilus assembly protein FimT
MPINGAAEMTGYKSAGARGFSTLELVMVLSVGIVLTAMAVPGMRTALQSYRSLGDARSLTDAVSMAKMRAAADFTESRVYADTSLNHYRVETWSIPALPTGSASKCWVTDGDQYCSAQYSSPNTPPSNSLSSGISFGYGSISSPPSGTQSTIGQAAACQSDAEKTAGSVGDVANSACIVFNSRGIPVDYTMAPTSSDALYLTDNSSAYGVTVLATGLIQTWRTDVSNANWVTR